MDKKQTVEILGIPLFAGDIESAIAKLSEFIKENSGESKCVSATGAHGLVYAKKHRDFANTLKRFLINLPDGMPSVWVGKLKGAWGMRRCYGPDFFQQMMIASSADPMIRHFFCGGNSGVAEELKRAVLSKFNNANVVGTFCPPYLPVGSYDYESIAATINTTNPTIIWIGLSTPKQECFAYQLSRFVSAPLVVCVGAAFDFHTDRLRQAPKLLQIAGLEWLFRLIIEPKRLFSRYIEIVPLFIWFNIVESLVKREKA